MLINGVTLNPRFMYDGVKQLCAFAGMIIYIALIISVSEAIYKFPRPMVWQKVELAGVFMWLEVQWMVFLGTLISNALFIAIRMCARHKIKMDTVPEMK